MPADTITRRGRAFATDGPSLLRLGVGAQRHLGAPAAYSTIASLPLLTGAWRERGGGCSYIPTATAAVGELLPRWSARTCVRHPVRTINMSQLGRALTDADLEPPVMAMVCWNSNPASIAPDQERVLAGLAREDLFTVVLEQFMTDTARHADVVLPATTALEHLDVVFSWGHHYMTWNEPAIAPQGEAQPNTEAFRLLAARLGLTDPCFAETDEELVAAMLANSALAGREDEMRERGWVKVDLGQGPTPHADGGFGTADEPARHDRRALRAARRGGRRRPGGALPARPDHAEDPPVPELDLRQPGRQHSAQPSPEVVSPPRRRAGARDRGRRARARAQRPRRVLLCRARVRRRPSGGGGGPDGLVEPGLPGRQEQPGHHVAGAHRRGERTGVQRQPRGAELRTPPASGAGPGAPSRQDPPDRLVQARALDAALRTARSTASYAAS